MATNPVGTDPTVTSAEAAAKHGAAAPGAGAPGGTGTASTSMTPEAPKGEGWGTCVYDWTIGLLVSCVKQAIYIISCCGYCCNDKAVDPQAVVDAAKAYAKAEGEDAKKAAFDNVIKAAGGKTAVVEFILENVVAAYKESTEFKAIEEKDQSDNLVQFKKTQTDEGTKAVDNREANVVADLKKHYEAKIEKKDDK